jgi:hypothetical protein
MTPEKSFGHMFDELFSGKNMPPKLASCLTSDRLILAQSAEQIEAILRSEHEAASLASNDEYKAIGRQFKDVGPVRFLISIPRLLEMATHGEGGEEAKRTFEIMGFKAFRSLIGNMDWGGEKFDSRMEALAMMSGERTGIAKILSMKNQEVAPSTDATKNTVFHLRLNLNPRETLDEIERMVRQHDPNDAQDMKESLESVQTPDGQTINLRTELFDNLREPLALTFAIVTPIDADSARVLLTINHANKDAIQRLLSVFGSMGTSMGVTSRDMRGNQIYDAAPFGVSVAATSDKIGLGSTKSVEAMVGGSDREDQLSADPDFRRALEFMPHEGNALFWVNGRRIYEAMAEMAKSPDENAMSQSPGGMMLRGMMQSLGPAAVSKPEIASRLATYQSPTIAVMSDGPDGLRLTSVQLRAEVAK